MAKKASAAATPPAFTPVVIPVKRGWLATDARGSVWWFKEQPLFLQTEWQATSNNMLLIVRGGKISRAEARSSLRRIEKASKLELRLVTE